MGGIASEVSPFSGGTAAAERFPIWMTLLISPLFFFVGGSEELGWRKYLQPTLEKVFFHTCDTDYLNDLGGMAFTTIPDRRYIAEF